MGKPIIERAHLAIETICEVWDSAKAAADWRSSGVSDTLRSRRYDAASARSAEGFDLLSYDQSGSIRETPYDDITIASSWIGSVTRYFRVLLATTTQLSVGGPFNPPAMETALRRAANELGSAQPQGFSNLVKRLEELASLGARRWRRAAPGTRIGNVVVEERTTEVETCTECQGVIAGTREDPVARIDGKPYHRTPCYNTVYQRRKRRAKRASTGVSTVE